MITRSPSSNSRRSRASALTIAGPRIGIGIIALTNPYIGQSGCELYSVLDYFGDSQSVVTIYDDHFSPSYDPVPQEKLGWVLNVFV